jgi:hypothetical protein
MNEMIREQTCRLLFYVFNQHTFSESPTLEIAGTFLYGIRYDISAIIYFNFVFILMHLIPNPFRDREIYQLLTKIIFFLFNSAAILLSVIDFEYFKYSKKRTTFDVFGMSSDWWQLLQRYLRDFWYLAVIIVLLLVIANVLYRRTEQKPGKIKTNYIFQSIICAIFTAIFVIGARGGLQLKPIKIGDAALDVAPQNIPLALNTPFTILRTYGRKGLNEVHYMSNEKASTIVPLHHRKQTDIPFIKMNVVIIIVESLSKEFVGKLNSFPGYTPFLDSLSNEGLLCTNAFANGTRSMEAVPAILASIPNLMDDSYIFSVYQGNAINSIGSILHNLGYTTFFFHGGTNGTMGFDSFIKLAGFEKYYGRTEYNNERDYDGFWGISDEEFLQFTAKKLNELSTPFCATIFTLSSHHPYSLPPKHANDFQGGTMPIHRTILYADYSLRKFFETISSMSWYKNTLFVITGDHTPAEAEHPFYRTQVGLYALPIIFFKPNSELHGVHNAIVQHIDIMPSILDYLHYNSEYVAFGQSIFDTTCAHYSTNFLNDFYQIVDDNYVLQFATEKSSRLLNYKNDTLLTRNIFSLRPEIRLRLENYLQALIQTYNYALIHNELSVANQ